MLREPVHESRLSPADYAALLRQFLATGVPELSVSFQGYEVTLPEAWPYVEAVLSVAKEHRLRRGFITHGMLLFKYTDRLLELMPHRISVSLDGADAEANDPIRGLSGAFEATVSSLRKVITEAPELRPRLAIASTLYSERNYRSLCRMPHLLRELGLRKWTLGYELTLEHGRQTPVADRATLERWLSGLLEAARREDIPVHLSDEFGFLSGGDAPPVTMDLAKSIFDPEFLIRVEPSGHVRVGAEILERFDPHTARRWDPLTDNIVETIDYRARVRRYQSKRVAVSVDASTRVPSE